MRRNHPAANPALMLALCLLLSSIAHAEYSYEASEALFHKIAWREYNQTAFDEARAQGKPVMLLISAVWCYWCHVYESADYLYSEPALAFVNENFIPVFVDSDKRPDLTKKYLEGGWPSTTFLTPEGQRIDGFSGPRPVQELLSIMRTAVEYNRRRMPAPEKQQASPSQISSIPPIPAPSEISAYPQRYVQAALASADPQHGGFGSGQKFPQPLTEYFLLSQYEKTGGKGLLQTVELAAKNQLTNSLSDYRLSDPLEGGFHRYSTRSDWTVPHFEKLLSDNANQLLMYSRLYQLTNDSLYADAAAGILRFADGKLWGGHAYYGSQDASETYYHKDAQGRRAEGPPAIDKTIYASWNAQMASALFHAGKYSNNSPYAARAATVADFLLWNMTDGHGVHHYYISDGGQQHLSGQLEDNALVLLAAEDAYESTLDKKYLGAAASLANFSLLRLFDWSKGGFYERNSPDKEFYSAGEAFVDAKPPAENGAMSLAMLRLYNITGDARYLFAGLTALGHAMKPAGGLDGSFYPARAAEFAAEKNLLQDYEKNSPAISSIIVAENQRIAASQNDGTGPPSKPSVQGSAATGQAEKIIGPQAGAAAAPAPILVLLAISLLAGALSLLSPCVISIAPAFVASTISNSPKTWPVRTLSFFLGIALVFSLLGAAGSYLGQFASFQLKSALAPLAGVLVALMGVAIIFDFSLFSFSFSAKAGSGKGFPFLTGAIMALGWTPCIGPILVSLFALASQSQTVIEGALMLFVYAMGISVPLFALAIFASRLPKSHVIWSALRGKELRFRIGNKEVSLHSTNVISGAFLIAVGALMATGYLFVLNSFVPPWLGGAEQALISQIK